MKEMVERCLVTVGKDENQRQGQLRSKSRLMQVFVS